MRSSTLAVITAVVMNALAVSQAVSSELPGHAARPVKVILDTDMYGDIDDALALAMLHALESRAEIELLAITISTETKWAARFVDSINTFYGRGDIPIGVVSGGVTVRALEQSRYGKYLPSPNGMHYTQYISSLAGNGGTAVFPHDEPGMPDHGDSVMLLRRVLADQPDHSVVMIGIGYMTNLAQLLESGPDRASPADGLALVRQKVRFLSVMAGNFKATGEQEFNLEMDVPAARTVLGQWPTPVVVSGSEIGARLLFPQEAIDRYCSYVDRHPIAETFRYAASFYRNFARNPDSPHDHATYDLTSVLYAARPDARYFTVSGTGAVAVLEGGRSEFVRAPRGNHRILELSDAEKARALEAMIMLVSQPPAHVAAP